MTPSRTFASANSQFALPGIPVLLQIDDELVAEVTERLLECVCRYVPAEGFQRLGLLAARLAVGAVADDTRSDRVLHAAQDRLVHLACRHHFTREQAPRRRVGVKHTIEQERVARQSLADKPGQPHVRGAWQKTLLAR